MMSSNTATSLPQPQYRAPAPVFTDADREQPPSLALAQGVTEVFCRAGSQRQFQLLLPSLAQHSYQGRWLTLVAPPAVINRQALVQAKVNLTAMRVIHGKVIKDYWATVEQCLLQGNSSVVIAWTDHGFCDELRSTLKEAALAGNCTIIVMRQLGHMAQNQNQNQTKSRTDTCQLSLAF